MVIFVMHTNDWLVTDWQMGITKKIDLLQAKQMCVCFYFLSSTTCLVISVCELLLFAAEIGFFLSVWEAGDVPISMPAGDYAEILEGRISRDEERAPLWLITSKERKLLSKFLFFMLQLLINHQSRQLCSRGLYVVLLSYLESFF